MFSQPLFASTAAVLLGSKAVTLETLQAFQSKYLVYADVRSVSDARCNCFCCIDRYLDASLDW